jgi:gluconate kinase
MNNSQRVNNYDLPEGNPLLAVLGEAVSNSLHSIFLAERKQGMIAIDLELSSAATEQQRDLGFEADYEYDKEHLISGFTITDNGQGLTDDNYMAFKNWDTSGEGKKETYACKGIGRILYLKLFNNVHISSGYKDGEVQKYRELSLTKEGAQNEISQTSEICQLGVKLVCSQPTANMNDQNDPVSLSEIKEYLCDHFLATFIHAHKELNTKNVLITLNLKERPITIDMVLYVESEAPMEKGSFTYKISDEEHTIWLYHVSRKMKPKRKHAAHRIIYCAGMRELENHPLENFTKKAYALNDEAEETFYTTYVMASVLNHKSNSNRTALHPFKEKEAFKRRVNELVLAYLGNQVTLLKKRQTETIQELLQTHKVYSYLEDVLKKATADNYDLSRDELRTLMYSLHAKERTKRRANALDKLKEIKKSDAPNMAIFADLEVAGMVELAEYMHHRREVISYFKQLMDYALVKKSSHELILHDMFAPKQGVGNEGRPYLYDEHNLWLIDERFTGYKQVFSDVKIKKIVEQVFPEANKTVSYGQREADALLLFNAPMGEKYNVVAIEFKGIGLDHQKNAVGLTQLSERRTSLSKLKEHVNEVWYYLITDLDETMIETLRRDDYKSLYSSDKGVYYRYYQMDETYVYVISYASLLSDTEMRHKIFFDLLPSTE